MEQSEGWPRDRQQQNPPQAASERALPAWRWHSRGIQRKEVLQRAHTLAEILINESLFRGDQRVHDDVAAQLDSDAGSMDRHLGTLIDDLVTHDAWKARIDHDSLWRTWAAIGLALAVLLTIGFSVAADIANGPGELSANETGTAGTLLTISGLSIFAAIGLGFLAFNGLDDLKRGRQNATQEGLRLWHDLDNRIQQWVEPIVSSVIYERQNLNFTSVLQVSDASCFGGISTESVWTTTHDGMIEFTGESNSAAVGLCGPRGAGKTTLIREICRSNSGSDSTGGVVGICVEVPVVYDHKEFLETIYSQLLDEVERTVLAGYPTRTPLRSRGILGRLALASALSLTALIAFLSMLIWVDQVLAFPIFSGKIQPWVARVALGTIGLCSITMVFLARPFKRIRSANVEPIVDLRNLIERGRTSLSADVITSGTINGTLSALGAGVTRSTSRQVHRGVVTHPALVGEFRNFVTELNRIGLLIRIGIDELDKLNTSEARAFLNGLKVIFGLPGTHFIVSVSEDAMSDFERRGVPIRDAFDSSLDEVLRIQEMTVDQSMELLTLRSRITLPLPFGVLCHCLSGGLPRELLRVARRLVRHNARLLGHPEFGQMRSLCWSVVEDDLLAKSAALWTVARRLSAEPYGTRFRSWLSISDNERGSVEQLMATCSNYLELPVIETERLSEAAERIAAIERLGLLTLEFVGYRYFAVTLIEFFSSISDADLSFSVTTAEAGGIANLSAARSRFADDPRLAWAIISRFREANRMEPVLRVPAEGLRLPTTLAD